MDLEEFKDDRPMPQILVPSRQISQQSEEDHLRASKQRGSGEQILRNSDVRGLRDQELQKQLLNFTYAVQCYELQTLQDQNRLIKIKQEIQSQV